MKRSAVFVLVVALAATGVWGGELAGVTMDDTVVVDGEELELNGMGLRKKLWVEVYVGGLYLPEQASDPGRVVAADGPKKMVMHFMTDRAKQKKMASAWREGFEANAPDYGAVADRVDEFISFFGDMKTDDVVEMVLTPGAGTTVRINGSSKGTIEGDDFQEALLLVWVGDSPPSDDFKKGVLGG